MRFRISEGRPPYLNAKDQRRLLSLVALLAMILLAVKLAGDPKNWEWMISSEPIPDQQASNDGPSPDRFRSRHDPRRPAEPKDDQHSPLGSRLRSDVNDADAAQRDTDHDTDVDRKILQTIRDDTLGVRSNEANAFYSILAQAREIPLSDLERAARDDVTFTVLMVDSDHFRGKLVTLEGKVKRLLPFDVSPNEFGIETLYEAWILTPDSPTNPIRVVTTSIPEGIPLGAAIDETVDVQVTGFFFKREGYAARGGLHTAPLILGQRMRWFRRQETQTDVAVMNFVPYIVVAVLLFALALAVIVWKSSTRNAVFHRKILKRITAAPPEVIDALPTVDQQEMFRQLAAETDAADKNAGNPISANIDAAADTDR